MYWGIAEWVEDVDVVVAEATDGVTYEITIVGAVVVLVDFEDVEDEDEDEVVLLEVMEDVGTVMIELKVLDVVVGVKLEDVVEVVLDLVLVIVGVG